MAVSRNQKKGEGRRNEKEELKEEIRKRNEKEEERLGSKERIKKRIHTVGRRREKNRNTTQHNRNGRRIR